MNGDRPILRAERLTKVYPAGARALDGLDLAVRPGEVFGFLGPNGAGKTTTVLLAIGALAPTGGSLEVLGRPAGDRAARARLGYLPEHFQFPGFASPRGLLEFHGRLLGLGRAESRRQAAALVEQVGLGAVIDRPVRGFSKGMVQRVGLAQALLGDPDLLLLDEPTSGLDPLGTRAVRDLILYLRGRGTTVFLNSHQLSEIELTCDRVAIIDRGRVVRAGAVEAIVEPTHEVEIRASGMTAEGLARLAATAGGLAGEDGRWVARVAGPGDVPRLAEIVVASGALLEALVPRLETLEEAFLRLVGVGAGGDDARADALRRPGARWSPPEGRA